MKEIIFESYEKNCDMATGYKIYTGDEQLATLEFRSHEWIAAVVEGYKVITLKTPSYLHAAKWILLMIESQENKKENNS